MDFQIQRHQDLVRFRDEVLRDPVAVEKWRMVVDHIVESAADRMYINTLWRECLYEEAILKSLQIWSGCGRARENLRKVLHHHKLMTLADKIEEHFGLAAAAIAEDHRHAHGTSHTNPTNTYRPMISKSVFIWTCAGASFCILAIASFGYLSSNTSPKGSDSIGAAVHGQRQTYIHDEQLKLIRDLITKDAVALQRWGTVVDYIANSPADELRIKSLIKRGDFDEAVLSSLRVWNAAGDDRTDLLQVLRNQGLNLLAGRISEFLQ